MRKSYIVLALLVVSIALILSGCDALFQNTFQQIGLGQPSDAKLQEQANSQDPVVAQNAQVTLIEQQLQTSGAAAIVSSINVEYLSNVGDNPNNIIYAIIPADLQGAANQDKLADAINGLKDLNDAIDKLAANIEANGATDAAKDQLQTALIVKVVAALEPAAGYTDIGTAVAAFVNAGEGANPKDYFNEPDLDALKNDNTINILLQANGAGSLEDFINSLK